MQQERTKQKIQSLSRYIIEKAECDSYRAGTRSKQWHIEADQKLLDAVGGRSVLLRQAGDLEKLTGISGKTSGSLISNAYCQKVSICSLDSNLARYI